MSGNGKTIVKKDRHGWGGQRAGAGPPNNGNAMSHGARALERLLQQGLDATHPIGALLAERRNLYVTDLGDPENMSYMELGFCERLAKLDLFEALLDARWIDPKTGKTRRVSWQRLQGLGTLRVRLSDSYARMASALGLRRRERLLDPFKAEEVRQLREAARAESSGDAS